MGHGLVSDGQRLAWLDLLSRLVGSEPRRVLDVGCGTGFLALRLAELGHTVTGVDFAPQMVERARRKAEQTGQQVDFRVGNAIALDSPAETYDVVVARHLIWNLPDPARGVTEWLRVLRPGGRLVLIEGKWGDDDAWVVGDAHPASRFLERAVEAVTTLSFRKGGSYLRRRLFRRRYRRIARNLPFSGGPPAERLAAFLAAQGLRDVVEEPLMDPTLWGEMPQFPRYLVSGTRQLVAGSRS
jgi:SAM-dependent methyltransferase